MHQRTRTLCLVKENMKKERMVPLRERIARAYPHNETKGIARAYPHAMKPKGLQERTHTMKPKRLHERSHTMNQRDCKSVPTQ
jgi:hypothetical protein